MIYLDHAATSPMDPRVLEAMMPYLTYEFGNPGSLHTYGREAKNAVDKARDQVSGFLHCRPEQVIFTSGGSEGNNFVILGLETELRRRGRTSVVISNIEHDSARKAAYKLCMKDGFHLRICPPYADGEVKLEEFEKRITQDVGLASVMLVNNETGVINDVASMNALCRERGVLFHTDAVQAAGILDLDTSSTYPVDFMTISSHKINGPKGMGAVFARSPERIAPLINGGDEQEFGFRGGTENVAGIVGFGEACRISTEEMEKHRRYLEVQHSQLVFMLKNLAQQRGIELRVNGNLEKISPKTLNICLPGIDAETLLLMLDNDGVFLSAGSACRAHENTPSHTLTAMGLTPEEARSSVRISMSHLNTPEEIDKAASEIIDCAATIKYIRL